ncbi:MAG: type III-B CRISPR module RAMP protein Cmr6, partial [Leptospiraceae bacterium]|nr:type III-B CRISPR module RAMP protein Cmr6 [Leptospiraceae bacterium]
MQEFEGVILQNFRVQYVNQNGKQVEKGIPGDKYALKKGEFVNESCVVYVENDKIVKILLKKTQEELPLKNPQKKENQSTASEEDMNSKNFFVPKDTKEALNSLKIENFGLFLKKFVPFENRFEISKLKQDRISKHNFDEEMIKSLARRQETCIKQLKISINELELTTDWRLALGLGEESVYETSIRLHSVYGIPYIPASSIKGVMRNWMIQKYFVENENFKEAEGKAIQNQIFCDLFGCPSMLKIDSKEFQSFYKKERAGKFIFFDAFPVNVPKLKLDIMNPHYSEYYTNQKPPGDYYNPIPIYFLVVTNTRFRFFLGVKKDFLLSEGYKQDDIKKFEI